MTRSFSSLTPPEALQVAIAIEQRNAEVYHRFAEMFTEFGDEESLEIAAVFWEMAVEERGHRAMLEERYVDAFGPLKQVLAEEELSELVEVPRLDGADIFSSDDDLSPRQRALEVALQAEVSAHEFYERMVKQTPPGPLRDMFNHLARMEDGHVSYFGAKLVNDTTERPTIH
jgi:rubrerythrin